MENEYISIPAFAKKIGRTPEYIRRLVADGKIEESATKQKGARKLINIDLALEHMENNISYVNKKPVKQSSKPKQTRESKQTKQSGKQEKKKICWRGWILPRHLRSCKGRKHFLMPLLEKLNLKKNKGSYSEGKMSNELKQNSSFQPEQKFYQSKEFLPLFLKSSSKTLKISALLCSVLIMFCVIPCRSWPMLESENNITDIFEQATRYWAPPEKLLLSDWADKYARLSPEASAETGRWTSYPYQRGIIDALIDPSIEILTWMKSARVGYTKILNWDTAFHIAQEPCSQLIVQPTVEDAAGYSKDEIAPMLRDMPILEGLVSEPKTRESGNTVLKKSYPGGILHLVGANSARGFRRITVKRVKFDEVDGYPPTAGHEGDQIQLGSVRAETFWDRKIILGSTPTLSGASRIESSFNESDQRFRFLPCPFCGGFQVLKFHNIIWPKDEPQHARYKCEFCEKLIPHSNKRKMDEAGEWRAKEPFNGHAGFHIWAAYSYSPNSTWAHIAEKFMKVKKDAEKLKTFTNTVLGETWNEHGEQPDWVKLQARAGGYKVLSVPQGGLLLCAGVDTQDNRLEIVVGAFGRGEECFIIYHGAIWGDPDLPHVWNELDDLLNMDFAHQSGAILKIRSMGIDSGGHKTHAVYNYCRDRQPRVAALKGASTIGKPILNLPSKVDVDFNGKKIQNGCELWSIGTDTAKVTIYNRLKLKMPAGENSCPGYFHFPIGLDDEFYKQLTAEKLVKKFIKGFPRYEWVNTRRNEVLDCTVYMLAAALKAGVTRIDWDKRERELFIPAQPKPKPKPRPKPQNTQNQGGYQRPSWMD